MLLTRKIKEGFAQQRRDAKKRDIRFDLSFEEWLEIWNKSGRLDQRGCRKGQYVMARYGDTGPYATWNVKIILCEENHSEATLGKPSYERTPESRAKISRANKGRLKGIKRPLDIVEKIRLGLKGRPKTAEHRAALSKAMKGRKGHKPSAAGIERIREAKRAWWVARKAKQCF